MPTNLELARGNGRATKTLQTISSRKGAGNGNAITGPGKAIGSVKSRKPFYPNVKNNVEVIKGSAKRARKIDSLQNDPAFR